MVLFWPSIGSNGFSMVFPSETMVFQWFWVWPTIGTNGFSMVFPFETMFFQWFPMVGNHWSNDGMVMIHRYGLADNYKPKDLGRPGLNNRHRELKYVSLTKYLFGRYVGKAMYCRRFQELPQNIHGSAKGFGQARFQPRFAVTTQT